MNFQSFSGVVTNIQNFGASAHGEDLGCTMLFSVRGNSGETVNFVVTPHTYFVEHETVKRGDRITGFYDADAPVPFIYPPQYEAWVIAKSSTDYFVKVDYFNDELLSQDGNLQLNIVPKTEILLENAQQFRGRIANRYLVVLYGPTTRSIPAQTTPYKIIVLCI
ncbi:hypothetical protein [Sporosarcina pasteurii]|uniref:Uncharacterized protein n=1 Tax=Sporosarcina pasteurii TaxID=1474 RepID=A0A380BSC6_SPOPA|nr:hypothetical protein [Sporosarcina pasteurii]MDS9471128.1 hypothetical protein [Sporosarcina pasteurii]QBQ05231.1 hypothetical protein E2C16_05890 [Sporosarcina pasteurii]SUJ05019.1 Uncharacterised protein [Sporosarcina pasteurii]